jgi:SAM-dependent methyltransferase
MQDADAFRRESRKGWSAVASGWGTHGVRFSELAMPVTTAMIEAANLQPGHQVLELAAGPGDVGYLAFELIQPGGSLITSDFSPDMLTVAQERAAALGIDGVRFKQIDAESIDIEAASLDAVLCRWGYMLMADPGAALRETRRVLRPGGRVALAAWTGPDDNRWSSVVGDVLVGRGLAERPPAGTPGQFAWAAPGTIEAQLADAGFVDDVEVTAVDFDVRQTFDQWWERTLEMSQQVRAVLGLPADEQAAIRDELRSGLERYDDGDGTLVIPARSWVAAASA